MLCFHTLLIGLKYAMITLIYKHSMFKSTQLDNQKGKNNIPTEGYYVVTIYGHWKGYFITTSLTWLTWLTHEPISAGFTYI
jgi:hypothetical protein